MRVEEDEEKERKSLSKHKRGKKATSRTLVSTEAPGANFWVINEPSCVWRPMSSGYTYNS